MDNISNLYFWCYKVLPLVYDDSLSYYEVLCKVREKINELVEALNNFENINNDYTDEQIKILKDYLLNEINVLRANTMNEINRLDGSISASNAELRALINETFNGITSYIDTEIFDSKIELINYVNEQIEKIGKSFFVVSPVSGTKMDVQGALNEMYDNLRYFSLTATEYDNLELTAQDYDAKSISASMYDLYGMTSPEERFTLMVNPFNGKLQDMRTVIDMLVNLHKDALTATQYDTKGYTATAFDALGYTAHQWDFEATILTA